MESFRALESDDGLRQLIESGVGIGEKFVAMDAPRGVGNPMPDRLGLRVDPDGSCSVMLLDNQTRAVAKLHSDGEGGGGVQVFKWDTEKKQVHVKTDTYDGPLLSTVELGG